MLHPVPAAPAAAAAGWLTWLGCPALVYLLPAISWPAAISLSQAKLLSSCALGTRFVIYEVRIAMKSFSEPRLRQQRCHVSLKLMPILWQQHQQQQREREREGERDFQCIFACCNFWLDLQRVSKYFALLLLLLPRVAWSKRIRFIQLISQATVPVKIRLPINCLQLISHFHAALFIFIFLSSFPYSMSLSLCLLLELLIF